MSSKSIVSENHLAINVGGTTTGVSSGGEGGAFRGDPWRFVVLGVYLVHSVSNAIQWITYSPIVDEVKVYYNVGSQAVDMLSLIYLIAYVAIVFVSCKVFEVSGLKRGLVVASAFNAAGAAIKLITVYGPRSINILYLSQILNSVTEVFLIATPPLVATEWFLSRERTVATALMTNALNLGIAVGMLMPTLFVGPNKQSAEDFETLYWVQFAICAAPFIGTLLTPSAPKYVPSLAAARKNLNNSPKHPRGDESPSQRRDDSDDEDNENRRHDNETAPILHASSQRSSSGGHNHSLGATGAVGSNPQSSFLSVFSTVRDSIFILKTHREFVLLCIVCGLQMGVVWAMATVLPQVMKPFGISEGQAGWMGFLNLISGVFAAPFAGSYVDRSKHYKPVLLVLMLVTLVCVCAIVLGFQQMERTTTEQQHQVVVMAMALGHGAVVRCGALSKHSLAAVLFGVELTFPHAESTTAPILAWAGSAISIALIQLFGVMLGDAPDAHVALSVLIVCALALAVSTLVMMFISSDLRRHAFELHQS
ncbi:MFS transporter, putative [Bodo saltans]|uniref:MFS transporter, putative n=1 Tax=Bodo saltans TaxID=75058 RepID=A0A0S4J2T0_BODSA|nr:MFS transporter, putative [Bodo saltans]|eukprot:CUG69700.1 MFS transporter, putative [Bodo saltans]